MLQRIFLGILCLSNLCLADEVLFELTIKKRGNDHSKKLEYDNVAKCFAAFGENALKYTMEPIDYDKSNHFISLTQDSKDAKLKTEDFKTIITAELIDCTTSTSEFRWTSKIIFEIPEEKGTLSLCTDSRGRFYFDIANPGIFQMKFSFDPIKYKGVGLSSDESEITVKYVDPSGFRVKI